jgi:hypothetical protein
VKDLLVITPSRGRPERLREMLDACLALSRADTDIVVGCDDDDLDGYRELEARYPGHGRVRWFGGPRTGLAGWTNRLAAYYTRAGEDGDANLPRYRAFASFGDDHIPRTEGWDEALLEAIGRMGGIGIAYGNDLFMGPNLPTAAVISAEIVSALGWMCEPSLHHMYVDNVWADIGQAAGCLAYVPDVVIEHVHFRAGKTPVDQVYATAESWTEADKAAYLRWREQGMNRDVMRVRLRKAMRGLQGARRG